MEPMNRQTKDSILAAALDADENTIDEYERLLAERFTIDPNMPAIPPLPTGPSDALGIDVEEAERPMTRSEIDARLAELHRRLYPGKNK